MNRRGVQQFSSSGFLPWGAGAVAVALVILAVRWQWTKTPAALPGAAEIPRLAVFPENSPAIAPASAWAYRQAATRPGGALAALLERDMCRLLPPSAAIFARPPPTAVNQPATP